MEGWKVVNRSCLETGLPILLLKLEVNDLEYTAHATDLTNIWSEKMDKRAIAKRALNDEVSIDVLAGEEQRRKLLEYVKAAIDGKPGTSMKISGASSSQELAITLTAELPRPLDPLLWNMKFSKAPAPLLTSELVVPSLRALFLGRSAIRSLLQVLQAKDGLITKMYDKIELSGIDLGSAFPGLIPRGAKSSSRETLQRFLPVLQEFDQSQWQQDLDDPTKTLELDELCKGVFSGELGLPLSTGEKGAAMEINSSVIHDSQPFDGGQVDKAAGPAQKEHTLQENEDASETESEAGGSQGDRVQDSEEHQSLPLSNHTTQNEQKKKIGTLGGSGEPKSYSAHPEAEEENLPVITAPPVSSASGNTPIKSRGKLGILGGKKATADSSTTEDPTLSTQSHLPSRKKSEHSQERGRGHQDDATVVVNDKRETSEERANRNRTELKREMEEKRKAPPKKKRKF